MRDSAEYLGAIERALEGVRATGPRFGLCLYNAGMDPFDGCDIGGLAGITTDILAGRERLVFDWCGEQRWPIAFVLAGGYRGHRLGQDDLVSLHRLTLSAAAASQWKDAPGTGAIH